MFVIKCDIALETLDTGVKIKLNGHLIVRIDFGKNKIIYCYLLIRILGYDESEVYVI